MKTYIAIFQGPTAEEARPLLATSDEDVVRRLVRLLRERLPDPTGETVSADRGERVGQVGEALGEKDREPVGGSE